MQENIKICALLFLPQNLYNSLQIPAKLTCMLKHIFCIVTYILKLVSVML